MDTQWPERPNLFKYGRKELSQDAMICWLLAWGQQVLCRYVPGSPQSRPEFREGSVLQA